MSKRFSISLAAAPSPIASAIPFPGLVLLDWKLPQRSGHEVLQWIRAQSALQSLPVVVCSSSKEPEDVSRAYQAAADGYLEKPLEPRSLLELLERFDLKREETRG